MLDSSADDDDDDDDDDDVAPPQLRAELFSSPERAAPRTPGVGVRAGATPGARSGYTGLRGDGRTGRSGMWDSDSDDELEGGDAFSPPKTLQFHVPQSRLLQTPGEFGFLFGRDVMGLHFVELT